MSTEEEAPSLFSSLPIDIVVNVIARVPRRYHPIISCVSKTLRSLVRSSELQKTRSLLGKDCFYVCFEEAIGTSRTYHWFSLTEDRRLVSIPPPGLPEPCSNVLMVGHEIYFIGGRYDHPSKNMWILDPRSGKLRQGPSRLAPTRCPVVGQVDDKIYVLGEWCGDGYKEIQSQVFDVNTQTWQVGPNPTLDLQCVSMSVVTPSLDRKIYMRNHLGGVMVYDTRDGKTDIIRIPDNEYYSKDVCVIDNVVYMLYHGVGLVWYNSNTEDWRVVHGLELAGEFWILSMVEYNGKLAFLWNAWNKMGIWCSVITLSWSNQVIHGRVEWSSCILSDVPYHYIDIMHYFGRSD